MEKKSSESVERISAVATRTVELLRSVAEVMAQLRRFAQQLGVEGADSLPALGAVDALAEQVLTTINGLRSEVSRTAKELNGRVDEVETAISETGETVETVEQQVSELETRVQGALTDSKASIDYPYSNNHLSLTTELTYESGRHFSHTTVIAQATAEHAGVMTATHVQRLEATETKAQAAFLLAKLANRGGQLPSHEELLSLLSLLPPQTLAEIYPDVVAVVEPKEAWFAFGVNTRNNNLPADVLVKVEDGILRRSQLPEGKDTIFLYGMDEVKFLNLEGFTRVGTKVNPMTEEQKAEWPTAKWPRIIDGFVNMEDITTLRFAFGGTGLEEARGDWSGLSAKCTDFWALFGTWNSGTTVRVVPEKLGTAKATNMGAIFGATSKVAQYPELDFASLKDYHIAPFMACQYPDDPPTEYYPGEVRARVRNFGAQPSITRGAQFGLLKNWNIDDVMYTFDEAAVYREQNVGAGLHGNVISRLTATQKARISAKNITIYRKDKLEGWDL